MSKSPVELPYEIWSHITTFIPFEEIELAKLYTLNRSFLALYLRERYKTLNLRFESACPNPMHYDPIILSKNLNRIQSSSMVAENVQILDLALTQFSLKLNYTKSPYKLLRILRKHIISKLKIYKLRKSFPSVRQIHGAFSELKCLTTITCALYSASSSPVFDPQRCLTSGISAAWTASRNTLTCLILTIKIYPLIDLGLDTITFPHLQQFHLILLSRKLFVVVDPAIDPTPPESPNISAASMTHFLERHKSTLEILTLAFPNNAQEFAAELLNHFPILPSLWNLQLHISPDGIIRDPSLPFGLFKTLQSNSQSLRDLSLIFDRLVGTRQFQSLHEEDSQHYQDWWMAQSFERIYFPKLQNLRLDFNETFCDIPLMLQFALSSTATSLEVRSEITQGDLQRLSALYHEANSKGECQLETLDLSIGTLTPSALSALAHGFPNIKTLKLRYPCTALQDWDCDPVGFILETSKLKFSKWPLENVYFYSRWPEYEEQLFRGTMMETLPHVRYMHVSLGELSYSDDRVRLPRI